MKSTKSKMFYYNLKLFQQNECIVCPFFAPKTNTNLWINYKTVSLDTLEISNTSFRMRCTLHSLLRYSQHTVFISWFSVCFHLRYNLWQNFTNSYIYERHFATIGSYIHPFTIDALFVLTSWTSDIQSCIYLFLLHPLTQRWACPVASCTVCVSTSTRTGSV